MMLCVATTCQTELLDITANVQEAVDNAGIRDGICMVFVPHTTAGITINENADPSVKIDMLKVLNQIIPWEAGYRHLEGNSPAHIKATLVGSSVLVAIEDGKLVLGTWQGIFFCEFDGPRRRKVLLQTLTS